MSSVQIFNRTFLEALQTTRCDRGQGSFNGFRVFTNTRVHANSAERRPGMEKIYDIQPTSQALASLLDGGFDAQLNVKAWDMTGRTWCYEAFLSATGDGDITNTGAIDVEIALGGTLLQVYIHTDGGTVLLNTAWDSKPHHVAVTRAQESVSLLLDGGLAQTAALPGEIVEPTTVSLANLVGVVDFIRLRTVIPPHWRNRETRLLNPRSHTVRACYRDTCDANGILWDLSRFEMHAKGATRAGVSTLGPAHHPVQLIHSYLDEDDQVMLYVVAGGRSYLGRYA